MSTQFILVQISIKVVCPVVPCGIQNTEYRIQNVCSGNQTTSRSPVPTGAPHPPGVILYSVFIFCIPCGTWHPPSRALQAPAVDDDFPRARPGAGGGRRCWQTSLGKLVAGRQAHRSSAAQHSRLGSPVVPASVHVLSSSSESQRLVAQDKAERARAAAARQAKAEATAEAARADAAKRKTPKSGDAEPPRTTA